MSLLNAWVSPSRAVVSVDTRSSNAARDSYGDASKMALVPHTNIVIAVNGYALALASVFSWCANNSQDDVTIDGLPSWLPQQMTAPEILSAIEGEGLVVAAVGFSISTNKFRGFRFLQDQSGAFVSKEIQPYFLLPGNPWSPSNLPVPDNRQSCLSIAKQQVKWANQHKPNEPIGGRLLVAEMTRKETKVYEAGSIG